MKKNKLLKIFWGKIAVQPWVVLAVGIAGWLFSGCASYNVQTRNISHHFESGNIQAAAVQISAEAEKRGRSKDAVVWRLEQGAILRTAGRLEESNRAFDMAEDMINNFEQKARVKISREAMASVTNLTTLPYEGFAYDKIMMNTYKALNYLQLGNYENARVELNRAIERQRDAIHINASRLEKAQEDARKQNLSVDLERVNNNERFKGQLDNSYAGIEQLKAYADYVNPLTVYVDGLFFMTQSTGSSDFERSRKSLERVLGMIGENNFIRQDLETLQKAESGQPIPATTYIIYETGLAPEREQIRIDIPMFLVTPGVPYVGAAFPKLRYRGNPFSTLNVSFSGTTGSTMLLSSMDAVITREFKNDMPLVITKTIIASAVKAGATYGLKTAVTSGSNKKEAGLFGMLVDLAGTAYQVTMNQADLRTWTTLPKEFQFYRLNTPADRRVELAASDSWQRMPVIIDDGIVNVVWVKSINPHNPLFISQFRLK